MTSHDETTATERRKVPRHRVLKAGKIVFNSAAAITCRVRNMSDAGALLEVESPVGIPDAFVLLVESDHTRKSCHVSWRKEARLGVVFD